MSPSARITMIDYSRTLLERAKARKSVGPYTWAPDDRRNGATRNLPPTGRGFYQAGQPWSLRVDARGSTFDLRLDYANTHHPMNWRRNGTFSHDENDTFTAIIARLPKGRGFLAGWTLGNGMCASLGGTIWDDIEDAARAAYVEAEQACERDAEHAFDTEDEDA